MCRLYCGLGMSSCLKKTSDMLASKCWPVWTIISSMLSSALIARLTIAALMNCGGTKDSEEFHAGNAPTILS